MLATDLGRRAIPWTELMLREGGLVNDLNVKTRDRASVAVAFAALGAAAAAPLEPRLLVLAAGAAPAIVALKGPLFRFFRRKRGLAFALGVVPVYWLYLLICGLGFGIGLFRHLLGRT
jgi:hypothetical protein